MIMADRVIPGSIDQEFTPKDRADTWRVFFRPNTSSGYDFLLVVENPKTKISYEIEVGIREDGRLCGQITPDKGDNGPDALVLFDSTPESARVSGNRGGMGLMISVNDSEGPRVIDAAVPKDPRGFY